MEKEVLGGRKKSAKGKIRFRESRGGDPIS